MKRMLSIVFIAVLLLSLAACGGVDKGADKRKDSYEQGMSYLSEGDFEEAIEAFTEAIENAIQRVSAYIGRGDAYVGYAQLLMEDEPKDAELSGKALRAYERAIEDYLTAIDLDDSEESVYQKAADTYITLGDTQSASELLEEGVQATGDRSLQRALDRLSGVIDPGELLPGSERWAALESFLKTFSWYGDYNAETAALRTTAYEASRPLNALERLMDQSGISYNDALYPGEAREYIMYESDPLGKWESAISSGAGYMKVNAGKLEWMLKNIFNCSKADIETMKQPVLAGESENLYYLDGYYYAFFVPFGGNFDFYIASVEQRGTRYYVEYNDGQPLYAIVSLKEIDSKEYWSIYECGDLEDTGEDPQGEEAGVSAPISAGSPAEIVLAHEDMWRDMLMESDPMAGNNFAYFMDLDFDRVPEFIVETPMMGTGFFTYRTIYQIQGENLVAVKNSSGEEGNEWDDINLWRDRQTGEYFYTGYDFLRDGMMWNSSIWARLELWNGELQSEVLFTKVSKFDEAVGDHVPTYYGPDNSTAISEAEFEWLQADLENRAEELGVQHGEPIEGWNPGVSQDEKLSLLLAACESTPLFW